MKFKLWAILGSVMAVAMVFSHVFAYNSGINSVTVAVQADALDKVAEATESTKVTNNKDSERYAALDKNNKSLQAKYDKLIKRSRDKVKSDDAEKYAVCTYDDDTLQLLLDSASGGKYTGSTASTGGGFDDTAPWFEFAGYWYETGDDPTDHRERQPFFQEPVFASELDRSNKVPPEPGIYI